MNGALHIVAQPFSGTGERPGVHRLDLFDGSQGIQRVYQVNQVTVPHAAFPLTRGVIFPVGKPRANLQKVTILAKPAQYLNYTYRRTGTLWEEHSQGELKSTRSESQ